MCTHNRFKAAVDVKKHPDGFTASVKVECEECGQPFVFPPQAPPPVLSQDRSELTVVIAPKNQTSTRLVLPRLGFIDALDANFPLG